MTYDRAGHPSTQYPQIRASSASIGYVPSVVRTSHASPVQQSSIGAQSSAGAGLYGSHVGGAVRVVESVQDARMNRIMAYVYHGAK